MSKQVSYNGSEIAVIGLSGRFPGAPNVNQFWENIRNGKETISFFTDEELVRSGVTQDLLNDPNYVKAKGKLEDVSLFDPAFFEYTEREADMMDPQFRILHECAWEALEDAGYNTDTYKGLIGFYAGSSFNAHWIKQIFQQYSSGDSNTLETAFLNLRDYLSSIISYKLNLKGPSFTIQTACSTSLVAIHQACQSLLNGECNMALAGGVSITLPSSNGYVYQEGMINSPDGHCRPFDEKAKGTVFGDGAGIVAFKLLEDALEDGDHIYAIVKGTAINNDGNQKVGYTAPSVKGQASVIRTALQVSEVEAESISYIEAHGTGTELGDPIEIEALQMAFNTDKKKYCSIGSVKSNVGHLNIAAGVTGFIKTTLALKYKELPASLHYDKPNPQIDFDNSPFYINTTLKKWVSDEYPLRAGVSSFGIGGTNAHVILEEAPEEAMKELDDHTDKLIVLSAKNEAALDDMTDNLIQFIGNQPDLTLANTAYTLQVGRKHFQHRRLFTCSNIDELIEAVDHQKQKKIITNISTKDDPSVLFMLTGQGAQYVQMGLNLYENDRFFHDEIDKCFELIRPYIEVDLKTILFPKEITEESRKRINETRYAQPLLFIIEYSLSKLLMEWGIKPDAMIGHSLGEYVAACLAEVMTLEEALKIVALRGKWMYELPSGAMLSLSLSEQEVYKYLEEGLSLAAVNSTEMCVVSGPVDKIDALQQTLNKKGIFAKRINTSHAFHSSMMDPILNKFQNEMEKIALRTPKTPFISNYSGDWITNEEATSPQYWVEHLRGTVRFSDGISKWMHKKNGIFIEVGPGNGLITLVNMHQDRKTKQKLVNTIRHVQEKSNDYRFLLNKVGELWTYGLPIDWTAFNRLGVYRRVSLPTYPFQRKHYWIDESFQINDQHIESSGSVIHNRPNLDSEYEAASTKTEKQLAVIWRELFSLNEVGLNDNFFEIGGHSLKATTLITRIHKEFHVKLTIADIYSSPTIKELSETLQTKDIHSYLRIQPAEMKDYYKLSSSQKRTYLINQYIVNQTAYNMPMVLIANGKPDFQKFEDTFNKLIQRHETLRTSFEWIEGEPVQKINDNVYFSLDYSKADEKNLHQVISEFTKPFALNQAPLLRAEFVELAVDRYCLLVDMHNIISDGTSMNIFIKDFNELYKGTRLSEPVIQYKDFAEWQHAYLQTDALKEQEKYWISKFTDHIPLLDMPLDFNRPEQQTFNGQVVKGKVSNEQTVAIIQLSKQYKTTVNVLLFHLYSLLLHKYSKQNEFVVGSLVAGRRHEDVHQVIGMFTNFLPIKVKIDPEMTFLDSLAEMNQNLLEGYENQDYPYDQITDQFSRQFSRNRNPLFDTMLIYHNEHDPDIKLNVNGMIFEEFDFQKGISKLDFKLDVVLEESEELRCDLQYNKALFKEETMKQLLDDFQKLIAEVIENPNKKICNLDVVPAVKLKNKVPIVISSTFTAEPIADYISWWGSQFGHKLDVKFAPYNQVFQQLLRPDSVWHNNTGLNVLMVRFEDFIRDNQSDDDEKILSLENYYMELLEILKNTKKRSQYFVVVFPVSNHLSYSNRLFAHIEAITQQWEDQLSTMKDVSVIDLRDLHVKYNISTIFDPTSDQAAHLPFTDEYYACIGTMIARKANGWLQENFKVIILDCDNTLWKGICGENGYNVQITEPFRIFQNFLLNKYNEGMLLALCSKNNEADVWGVFARNPDMVLQKEHFVTHQINWNHKSDNIIEIAKELNLGLDSFIFVDDSYLECTEVMTNAPDVLTLCLPKNQQQIPRFMDHVWAFDRMKTNELDRKRTTMYVKEKERQKLKRNENTYDGFLEKLGLQMSMKRVDEPQIPRVSQLTQRTNQFNLSTIRRNEQDVKLLIQDMAIQCWQIEARDRFGDYGLVGVVITKQAESSLYFDTFLLSCRVLGRNIEKAVLVSLKKYCEPLGIERLVARYVPTEKNTPMLHFLTENHWEVEEHTSEYTDYQIDVKQIPSHIEYIEMINDESFELATNEDHKVMAVNEMIAKNEAVAAYEQTDRETDHWEVFISNEANLLHIHQYITLKYYHMDQIMQIPLTRKRNIIISKNYKEPTTALEKELATIWEEILCAKSIGIDDDFFQLGGNSLLAIKVEVELEKRGFLTNNVNVLYYNTIWKLAKVLSTGKSMIDVDESSVRSSEISQDGTVEIQEIQPFNDIYYRDCFYNSFFPIIQYLGGDVTSILIYDTPIYRAEETDAGLHLEVDYITNRSIDKIIEDKGINVQGIERSEHIIIDIKKAIAQQKPVIIWVDCYYESIRSDTYMSDHIPHTWLIYGYNDQTNKVHIIEHIHKDNLTYEKREIDFEDCIKCYIGYLDHFHQERQSPSFFTFDLSEAFQRGPDNREPQIQTLLSLIKMNQKEIESGLQQLTRFNNYFQDVVLNQELLKDHLPYILESLNSVVNNKKVEHYKINHLFGNDSFFSESATQLLKKWESIRILIAKYMYSNVYKEHLFKESIHILDDICSLETQLYNRYAEMSKNERR